MAQNPLAPRIPFSGRLHVPENVKSEAIVVLVPFYKAKSNQLQRHVQFCLDLGFRVCQFELESLEPWKFKSLMSSRSKFGMKSIWTDQIEGVLNSMAGPKIVFSFSNPSASAIEAIARRQAVDILGLVCDSGPSGHFVRSISNLLKVEGKMGPLPTRWLSAMAMSYGWSLDFRRAIFRDIEKLPSGFRVLSVRGWKDNIISAYDIDAVFEPHSHIQWKKLSLPLAGHLNGLKDFPEEYKPPVEQFLVGLESV